MRLIRNPALIISRNIIHAPSKKLEPKPVTLSYASYEDTKTRDIQEIFKNSPLLILHGIFGCKGNWKSICKALQRRTLPTRKVIAVDARNHGDSTHSNEHSYQALGADVRALLLAERIPKVAVLGHGMGGRTAMYLALQYPALIERLIIVDTSPTAHRSQVAHLSKYFAAMASIKVPPKTVLSSARLFVDTALIAMVPEKSVRTFLITNLIQKPNGSIAWRINLKALRDNFAHIAKFPIEPDSGTQFLGPTTFIAGGSSNYIKDTDHSTIKKLFPNSKILSVPGAGHWVHSQKPAEFLEIVVEALKQPI